MRKILIIELFIGISFQVFSDIWEMPTVERYYSENGKFMLKVLPTVYPDKYWDWQRAKPNKKKKYTTKDTTIVLCHAILFHIENTDTIEIWNKRLINKIAPVTAIVSNDGKSIVTFDNWGSMGYGLDVMVTYDENGGLVKRYQLEDFSPFPINEYMMSISSIWWNCGAKYINYQTVEICFLDEWKNKKTRKYNIITKEFE